MAAEINWMHSTGESDYSREGMQPGVLVDASDIHINVIIPVDQLPVPLDSSDVTRNAPPAPVCPPHSLAQSR